MDIAEFQKPFRHWVIDGAVPAKTIADAAAAIPPKDWSGWVRYDNECERKRTIKEFADLDAVGVRTDHIAALFDALNSWTWLAFLERLTGIAGLQADPTLHGAGIHCSDPGDFLRPHIDYALHPKLPGMRRRLNLIAFLTERWSGIGGEFELYDDEGRDVIKAIEPAFGRIVLWEPTDTAFHGTAIVSGDVARVTAAVYYLAAIEPAITRKRALFVPRR